MEGGEGAEMGVCEGLEGYGGLGGGVWGQWGVSKPHSSPPTLQRPRTLSEKVSQLEVMLKQLRGELQEVRPGGALWGSMGCCGALWGAMGHYEVLWRETVGCYGVLWGNVGCYGAL